LLENYDAAPVTLNHGMPPGAVAKTASVIFGKGIELVTVPIPGSLAPKKTNTPYEYFRQCGDLACHPGNHDQASIAGAFSSVRTVHSTQIVAFISIS